jgi:hypothetical protein
VWAERVGLTESRLGITDSLVRKKHTGTREVVVYVSMSTVQWVGQIGVQ